MTDADVSGTENKTQRTINTACREALYIDCITTLPKRQRKEYFERYREKT